MNNDKWAKYGAATGLVAVVLYVVGTLVLPTPPDFDAPANEVAAYFADEQTGIQVATAFYAAAAAFFLWFVGTLASVLRRAEGGPRLSSIAFGAGVASTAIFITGLTAFSVAALRADEGVLGPEITQALFDAGNLGFAAGSLVFGALFAAVALVVLRRGGLPNWLGWLAALTGILVALRVGALFDVDGAFAADGVLGYWAGIVAFLVWTAITSVVLYSDLDRAGGGVTGRVSGAVDRARRATGT
jgi:hypothetical protein